MMRIDNRFDLGQIVYAKTDTDQLPRIITAIQLTADGGILYKCSQCNREDYFYEVELMEERDALMVITN